MCSIIGYMGKCMAAPVIIESLKKMEYRGYDSVGIATLERDRISLRKDVGKVLDVDSSLQLNNMPGQIGIGHTRWATHGGITKLNAHPHTDCTNNVVVVHNGIIDNYQQLKDTLLKQGHIFQSQTDSEVIAHLIETYLKKFDDVKKVIIETCKQLRGSYAFVAIFKSGLIAGARLDEPLIIGIGNDVNLISSSKNIFITGSGTSYHSALLAKYLFYKFAKIRTEIIMSSEFEYMSAPIDENSLLIAISQSGETADVLNSVKIAKEYKAKILSIVNISTSSLSRLSDHYVSINCGPEMGVAATKSFTAQLATLYSIIDNLCLNKKSLDISTNMFGNALNEILIDDSYLEKIADDIKSVQDIYILGKSFHYPIALEG